MPIDRHLIQTGADHRERRVAPMKNHAVHHARFFPGLSLAMM